MTYKKKILLSILIPTKNRQVYATHAIASALKIDANNIEVIVQDCSDDGGDSLRSGLNLEYPSEDRLNYFYDQSQPSMTDNWNNAIANANGKFILCIGDDDAVLPILLDVVKWMDQNNVDAVRQPITTFMWPDATKPNFQNSMLSFSKFFDGNFESVDIVKNYSSQIKRCGFGYTAGLPNVYHTIIRKAILDKHRSIAGHYLSGTSLDAYASFAYARYVKSMFHVNYPFSIHGICPSSNSSTNLKKDRNALKLHYKDFTKVYQDKCLPNIMSSEVSITESMLCALNATSQTAKKVEIDYSVLYGRCAAIEPRLLLPLFKQYRGIKNECSTDIDFIMSYIRFSRERFLRFLINFFSHSLLKISESLYFLLSRKLGSQIKFRERDIGAASDRLSSFLLDNKIFLNTEDLFDSRDLH